MATQSSKVIPSNDGPTSPIIVVHNEEELREQLDLGQEANICIDPRNYDISAEAAEPLEFSFGLWLEDVLVNQFAPFSIPWIWRRYGTRGLREAGFFPSRKKGLGAVVGEDEDPEPQPFQPAQHIYFNSFVIFSMIRWGFYAIFFIGGFQSVEPGDGRERGPIL